MNLTALYVAVAVLWIVTFLSGFWVKGIVRTLRLLGTTLLIGIDPQNPGLEIRHVRVRRGIYIWKRGKDPGAVVFQGDFAMQERGRRLAGQAFLVNLQNFRIIRLLPHGDPRIFQHGPDFATLAIPLPEDATPIQVQERQKLSLLMEVKNKIISFLDQQDGFAIADTISSIREQKIRRDKEDWKTRLMALVPFLAILALILGVITLIVVMKVAKSTGAA